MGFLTCCCSIYNICLLISVSTISTAVLNTSTLKQSDLFIFVFIFWIDLSSLCSLIRIRSLIKIPFRKSHIVALILFRFQSYLPDGSVCDVRCLLGRYSGDDLQEVTWQARWLYYACQRWKELKHAHWLKLDWTWDTYIDYSSLRYALRICTG